MLPRDGCTRGAKGAHIWPQRAACEGGLHVACARGPSWRPRPPAPGRCPAGRGLRLPRCSGRRRQGPYGMAGSDGQGSGRARTGSGRAPDVTAHSAAYTAGFGGRHRTADRCYSAKYERAPGSCGAAGTSFGGPRFLRPVFIGVRTSVRRRCLNGPAAGPSRPCRTASGAGHAEPQAERRDGGRQSGRSTSSGLASPFPEPSTCGRPTHRRATATEQKRAGTERP
jgi:hypothetical protein